MNIYLVCRTNKVDYDEYYGYTISAKNSNDAKQTDIAKTWDKGSFKAIKIGTTTNKRYFKKIIVLASFNAG